MSKMATLEELAMGRGGKTTINLSTGLKMKASVQSHGFIYVHMHAGNHV